MKYSYKTENVCPIQIDLEIAHDIVKDIEFIGGGCQGNLAALKRVIIGMKTDQAIETFKGVICGKRGTSCMNELTKALENFKQSNQ